MPIAAGMHPQRWTAHERQRSYCRRSAYSVAGGLEHVNTKTAGAHRDSFIASDTDHARPGARIDNFVARAPEKRIGFMALDLNEPCWMDDAISTSSRTMLRARIRRAIVTGQKTWWPIVPAPHRRGRRHRASAGRRIHTGLSHRWCERLQTCRHRFPVLLR